MAEASATAIGATPPPAPRTNSDSPIRNCARVKSARSPDHAFIRHSDPLGVGAGQVVTEKLPLHTRSALARAPPQRGHYHDIFSRRKVHACAISARSVREG